MANFLITAIKNHPRQKLTAIEIKKLSTRLPANRLSDTAAYNCLKNQLLSTPVNTADNKNITRVERGRPPFISYFIEYPS
jgi:hypothetical protein